MIFYFNREMLFRLRPRQSLGHGPRFQNAFHFQPEIVMQPAGIVFLDNKTQRAWFSRTGFGGSRGLSRLFEVALPDRKSTRLNSSHLGISYAVFCLKKK